MSQELTEDYTSKRWIRIVNNDSVEIPPYGAIMLVGVITSQDKGYLLGGWRPDANNLTDIAFNSAKAIPVGGFGIATLDYPAWALIGSGASDTDLYWGTQTDSFELNGTSTFHGFRQIAPRPSTGLLTDRIVVQRQQSLPNWVLQANGGTVSGDLSGIFRPDGQIIFQAAANITIDGSAPVNEGGNSIIKVSTTAGAGANTTLSNLVAPTAINESLISDTDSTDDLGSSSSAWKDLFVDTVKSIAGENLALTPATGQNITCQVTALVAELYAITSLSVPGYPSTPNVFIVLVPSK